MRCVTPCVIPLAVATAACVPPAHAGLLGLDTFSYESGAIAGQAGGVGWVYGNAPGQATPIAWSTSGVPAQVEASGLVSAGGAAIRAYGSNGDGSAIPGAGCVYFGVDLQFRTSDDSAATSFAGVSSLRQGIEYAQFGRIEGQSTYGIALPGVAFADSYLSTADYPAVRLVGSIQWDSTGGQGVMKLWVGPDAEDYDAALAQEPSQTTADAILYYGSNSDWSDAVQLASESAVAWDNLVVATTFNEAVGIPEPASLAALALTTVMLGRYRTARARLPE